MGSPFHTQVERPSKIVRSLPIGRFPELFQFGRRRIPCLNWIKGIRWEFHYTGRDGFRPQGLIDLWRG